MHGCEDRSGAAAQWIRRCASEHEDTKITLYFTALLQSSGNSLVVSIRKHLVGNFVMLSTALLLVLSPLICEHPKFTSV